MSKTLSWEDFRPGDRIESPGITVTEGAIIDFAQRFDSQPFHMDLEAAKESLYGGIIASGIHTVALTWRLLLMTGVLTANLGSPGFDELRWLRPVRPGDTLRVVAEVIDVHPSTHRPDRGTVRLRLTTMNQHGEAVQTVLCNQLIARRRE
ncbi:MAG TPA: MaoC family dehydratase [Syntrophales bacterium]|nr:MaoC family dehydratase [Syntrophales bacterium]